VFSKERFTEGHQIEYWLILGISPPACELVGIRTFLFRTTWNNLVQMLLTYCVAVVLSKCSITDNKQLNIKKQSRTCPKALSLVPIDLVEGFSNVYTSTL
jgi:hypothetical protein